MDLVQYNRRRKGHRDVGRFVGKVSSFSRLGRRNLAVDKHVCARREGGKWREVEGIGRRRVVALALAR